MLTRKTVHSAIDSLIELRSFASWPWKLSGEKSHNGRAGLSFDQFDLVPVRRVDEDETAAGGCGGRAVGDLDALGLQGPDGLVQVAQLHPGVDQILHDDG